MNDFERQLSNQPLRQPPSEWRAGILSATEKIITPVWTWRDWFWPSPATWGALAAVWVGAFVLAGSGQPSSEKSMEKRTPVFSVATPLYAFAPHRDLSALLDSLN